MCTEWSIGARVKIVRCADDPRCVHWFQVGTEVEVVEVDLEGICVRAVHAGSWYGLGRTSYRAGAVQLVAAEDLLRIVPAHKYKPTHGGYPG